MTGDPFSVRDIIVDEISTLCNPQIFPNSYVSTVDGKNVVVIEVPPGTNRPYYITSEGIDNGTYVRISASSRLAGPDTLRDLMMEGANKSFDGLDYIDENNKGLSGDAVKKLCSYLSARSKKDVTPTDLMNMGLLTDIPHP